MDRIYVIIIFLKNNPETIEIKSHEDSCSIKIARGVDKLSLTSVCRQIGIGNFFSVRRKNATKTSTGKYLSLKLKRN